MGVSQTDPSPPTTQLFLSSGNGPVYRTVLRTPPRDALPSEIPIIDVSGIFSPALSARQAVAAQIRDAAQNTGFFYIVGHGIPSTVTDGAYQGCLDFFRQPASVKTAADATRSPNFHGWKPPGAQRINPSESVDLRESFSWRYDAAYDPDVPDPDAVPAHIKRFLRHDPDGFPWSATTSVPHFRENVLAYWRACLALGRHMVHAFALGLGLEETALDNKFSHPDAALALNYYPPLPEEMIDKLPGEDAEEQVSIGSHTDFQLFTILWQDAVGGLQVLSKDGQWLNARPVEGSFVVNIGDYLARITNDRYVSTVHRAQNRSGRERVSMPFFFGFNLNESCGVLDCCVGEGEEKKYEEISCIDWVERRVKAMHSVKGLKEGGK